MVTCGDPKSEYRVASWKGMTFHVQTDTTTVGRRGDLYEYPFGEQTGWRDLGLAAATIQIDGYLIGADHHRQAARMRALAESPGPGLLVHPIYGERMVACRSLTISHEIEDARRLTRLSFDFVEVGDSVFPAMHGGVPAFYDAIDTFIDTVRAGFLAAWNLDDVPAFQRADSLTAYRGVAEAVYDAVRGAAKATAETHDAFLLLEEAVRGVGGTDADTVLRTVHRGIEVIYETADPVDAARTMQEIQRSTARTTAPVTDPSTRNVEAIVSLPQRLSVAYYVLAVNDTPGLTVDDVMRAMEHARKVLDAEEQIASQGCDDVMVRQTRTTRAQVFRRLMELVYGSSATVRYSYQIDAPDGIPSLVLAHEVYGDSRRAAELERDNDAPLAFAAGRKVRLYTEAT